MELQSALEEAEATLEQEENKVLRCQMELTQVRLRLSVALLRRMKSLEWLERTRPRLLIPCKQLLRQQIARDVQQNKSLLTQMKHLLIWEMSTSLLLLLRGSLKLSLISWGLILMR